MQHLTDLQCKDCGESHGIYKGVDGYLISLEKCKGKIEGAATKEEKLAMEESISHTKDCLSELMDRFHEGNWYQVQALADEMTIKLNSLCITVAGIGK